MTSPLALALLGIPLLVSAFLSVTSKNLVHAVLWLATALGATAGLFVVLGAPFLATVQVLLYIGGIVTLLIFGVMLTQRAGDAPVLRETVHHVRAAVVAVTLFAVIAVAVVRTPGLEDRERKRVTFFFDGEVSGQADFEIRPDTGKMVPLPGAAGSGLTTGDLADTLLGKDLLAFEVLSLLLLAAMIGAIVIARPRDAGVPAPVRRAPRDGAAP